MCQYHPTEQETDDPKLHTLGKFTEAVTACDSALGIDPDFDIVLLKTTDVECRSRMKHAMIVLPRIVGLLILLSHPCSAQVAAPPSVASVDSRCLAEILINTPLPYDPAQVADAKRKADGASKAIQQGAKFEDIARKYSDGPTAADGGRLGLFKRGQLAKSIEDKVFVMRVGEVSDIIRTKQGFAILKVTDCGLDDAHVSRTIEILGDTQGIDFGPYVQRVGKQIRANWYRQIPLSAEERTGQTTIEFAISSDGKLIDVRLVGASGDPVLDRAAFRGVTLSSPLPRLPSDFTGPYFRLRLHFFYNLDKKNID